MATRFNYAENDGMQLWEIAQVLGVSTQQAHRIEQQAMAKLRRMMAERGYRAEDFYDTGGAAYQATCEGDD